MIKRNAPILVGLFFILSVMLQPMAVSAAQNLTLIDVIAFLSEQAEDLKKGLISLKALNEDQKEKRDQYLEFADNLIEYYQSLKIADDGSNVKEIAVEIKEKRAETVDLFREAADFLLVYQTKQVLGIAENRFLKVRVDLDKLIELKILKREKSTFLLNEAQLLLIGAGDLAGQAEELLATTSEARLEIRDLIGDAISKIKLAYKKFLDISSLLKDAIK